MIDSYFRFVAMLVGKAFPAKNVNLACLPAAGRKNLGQMIGHPYEHNG
jgi:hypothetical protein